MRWKIIIWILVIIVLVLIGWVVYSFFFSCFGGEDNSYNIEAMNMKTSSEINKLFVIDEKVIIYLPNLEAEIKQGKLFGVGFGIRNNEESGEFTWETIVVDDDRDIMDKCGVRAKDAEDWITTGGSNSRGVPIASGEKYYSVIRFNIPKEQEIDDSKCIVRFRLDVYKDGEIYLSTLFDVKINNNKKRC